MELLEISPNLHIKVNPPPQYTLPSAIEEQLDALWEQEKKRCGERLFNGQIFSVGAISPEEITGHFTEYKHTVGQILDPTLYNALRVKTLSVTGITTYNGQVLVGQRADDVFQLPGAYEFVPSGSIDPSSSDGTHIDPIQQVLAELAEEANIPTEQVVSAVPVLLGYEPKTHQFDLFIKIELSSADFSLSDEYKRIFWANMSEINTTTPLYYDCDFTEKALGGWSE